MSLQKLARELDETARQTAAMLEGITEALEILADVSEKIISHSGDRTVVLGDFNIDGATIGHYFPDFREAGFEEASTDGPTTPKNRTYDHLLYKGLQLTDKSIDSDVLTDHYILITDLELN